MNRKIEVPVHDNSVVTSRSLDSSHVSNSQIMLSNNTTHITELKNKLKELKIRFDNSPNFLLKKDYKELIDLISSCLLYLYESIPLSVIIDKWNNEPQSNLVPSERLTKTSIDLKANIIDIPTNVSQLNNDSRYLTEETDPTVPDWAKEENKPTYTAEEVGALPDDTFIPENVSDLNNDAGYITSKDIPVIDKTSDTSSSFTIDPNKMYMFGTRASLTITLNSGTSGIVNEYMFLFTSGSTATTLNVPNTVVWLKDPDIQTGKKYAVSIENNLGIIGEWDNE